ncbi:MAG: hypothetical protein J6R74_03265 [Tidjanibacter sp.]|nr:hypothetical protein [Tidjanibacter sp.]
MFGIGQSLRRKPRQFSYNPRYYDAELEARNQRRIELGHAPLEKDEQGERKPGDLLRARSQQRQQMAERDMATRRKSSMTRVLFVVLLIVGFYMLLRSINF